MSGVVGSCRVLLCGVKSVSKGAMGGSPGDAKSNHNGHSFDSFMDLIHPTAPAAAVRGRHRCREAIVVVTLMFA